MDRDWKAICAAVLVVSVPLMVILGTLNYVVRYSGVWKYDLTSSQVLTQISTQIDEDQLLNAVSSYMQHKTDSFELKEDVEYQPENVFKAVDKRYPRTRRIPIAGLVLSFAMAYVAEKVFGIADVTGAYVAGVILSSIDDSDYITRKMDVNSYMIFGPILFRLLNGHAQLDENFAFQLVDSTVAAMRYVETGVRRAAEAAE